MIERYIIYGLVILGVLGAAWGHGYMKGSNRLYAYQAEQAKEGARVVVKQGAATERVVTRYIKVAGATQTVTVTVEKEVERYANTGYCLDGAWRRLHDAAASNAVPAAPGLADGESGAPEAARALQTVTGNYAACHRTADRLDALQHWVREQADITRP